MYWSRSKAHETHGPVGPRKFTQGNLACVTIHALTHRETSSSLSLSFPVKSLRRLCACCLPSFLSLPPPPYATKEECSFKPAVSYVTPWRVHGGTTTASRSVILRYPSTRTTRTPLLRGARTFTPDSRFSVMLLYESSDPIYDERTRRTPGLVNGRSWTRERELLEARNESEYAKCPFFLSSALYYGLLRRSWPRKRRQIKFSQFIFPFCFVDFY